MIANEHNESIGVARLQGRPLQLFWSVAAELQSTRESDNDEYAAIVAEFFAALELDMQRGEIQALPPAMRVLLEIQERTGLGINAIHRLLGAIGLDMPALEANLQELVSAGHVPAGGGEGR